MTGGRSWGDFTGRFFKADSIWNKKLPADVGIDPVSAAVVEALADRAFQTRHPQINDDGTRANFFGLSGFNFKDWNTPVHIASEGNFTVQPVYLDRPYGVIPANAALREAWSAVPIPDDARPAGPWPGVGGVTGKNPGDNHMVVYQPEELVDPATGDILPGDRMWEFWKARQHEIDGPSDNIQAVGTDPDLLALDGWHAVYGAAMEHVSHDDGAHYDQNSWKGSGLGWGAAATKIPLVGGLVMQEESIAAAAGDPYAIPHALRLHVLQGATPGAIQRRDGTSQIRWPGFGGGDGASQYTYSPAEGDLYRLPPTYPTEDIPNNFISAIATAIRDYGMIITDTAGATTIVLEPRNTIVGARESQTDIYAGPVAGFGEAGTGDDDIFQGFPTNLAQTLPWDSMQLVDKAYRPTQPIKQRLIIGTA